jgi:hypothetical protein
MNLRDYFILLSNLYRTALRTQLGVLEIRMGQPLRLSQICLLSLLILSSCGLWSRADAQDQSLLLNDREGQTRQYKDWRVKQFREFQNKFNLDEAKLRSFYIAAIAKQKAESECSFSLVRDLSQASGFKSNDRLLSVIALLRLELIIDDFTAGALENAFKTITWAEAGNYSEDFIPLVGDSDDERRKQTFLFSRSFSRGACFPELIKSLYSAFRGQDKTYTLTQFSEDIESAYGQGWISEKALMMIKAAIRYNFDRWGMTLQNYVAVKRFLRKQRPLTETQKTERADYVTQLYPNGFAYREHLYQVFGSKSPPLQILILSKFMADFKERLKASSAELNFRDKEKNIIETYVLSPMERFRASIQIMRISLKKTPLNVVFEGRSPSYSDLLAASFETGVLTKAELDKIAELEKLWKKESSFLKIASPWIRMLASVATVVLDPTLAIFPAIGLVALDYYTQEKTDDDTDTLFTLN